ncbi:uncharacterized protein BDW43DRAFT_283860 [Aspergillus alliaceus]|uniref:uncharacterized protein n=1 Tax=Petromyces alliaceus TaxID=209559 RepID=UPI0012A58209|nr:uncharacterized protein BDW43DRAFT_283860 [Aspergillus alliaceus]KAB8230965.1 hypothetical protein BDW43DRAFT_283860 [Aspergillus alliaceus]
MIVYMIDFSWENGADNKFFNGLGYRMLHEVEAFAKKVHADYRYIYLNYAAPDQDPLHSYGEDNLRELARVAKKYDPDAVFQGQAQGRRYSGRYLYENPRVLKYSEPVGENIMPQRQNRKQNPIQYCTSSQPKRPKSNTSKYKYKHQLTDQSIKQITQPSK